MQRQPTEELRQWERDWRASATTQMQETARSLADVAASVREIVAEVRDLKSWRDDVERRKDDRAEKVPDTRRADYALAVSVGMLVIYLATFVAQHWRP